MTADWQITPLGDAALVVQCGTGIDEATFRRVQAVSQALQQQVRGAVEQVPAFTTVTLYYDPLQATYAEMQAQVQALLEQISFAEPSAVREVTIPVCYGGAFGSDLEFVAAHAQLTPAEVVAIHSRPAYRVHMLGFAPGFPYLGGLPAEIATPRRASPRLKVAAGSVGIGGEQTGIYPLETPGGWQIIGRTPLALFRPWDEPPTLLRAGDLVRFLPITPEQFHAYEAEKRQP